MSGIDDKGLRGNEIDCRAASRLLSDRLDTPLPPQDADHLAAHLRVCSMCRNAEAQLALLRRSVRDPGGEEEHAD